MPSQQAVSTVSINDFPPKLLEQLFSYLTAKEQRACRQVCKNWFNVLSSSPYADRTLNLKGSELSRRTKPVKIFGNSKFKYNSIVFDGNTFIRDSDLTAFWAKIGAEVEEICIKGDTAFTGAIETGLEAQHFPKMKKLTIELPLLYDLIKEDYTDWWLLLTQVEIFCVIYHWGQNDDIDNYILNDFGSDPSFTMSNVTTLEIHNMIAPGPIIFGFFQKLHFPNFKLCYLRTSQKIWLNLKILLRLRRCSLESMARMMMI